ncbi:MAG: SufB/SufD family protein, partial [Actinomycetes bacterium]
LLDCPFGPRPPRTTPQPRSVTLPPFTAESFASLPGPGWLRSRRAAAAERFAAADLPTQDLEVWRYSRIDDLDLDRYTPAVTEPGDEPDLPPALRRLIEAFGPGARVVTLHNGFPVGQVDFADDVVRVRDLRRAEQPVPLGDIAGEPDALITLNAAACAAPIEVRIARRAVMADPVVVVHWVDGPDALVGSHVVVRVGEGAEAQVVEIVAGPDDASLVVPVTELDVADRASLGYLHLQLLGTRAWQTGLQASHVGQEATLTSAAVALGGDYARLRTDSALMAPGGTARLLAVYFGDGTQMHDFRTVQEHRAPHSLSDLLYKGAVANRSRSVYTGLIRVEKGARGTNALQTNRNLVLDEGAHAESVPNLEIEDNDVRCSHASAVGPIAEDQRYYVESRGVPTDVADRLIALGFLDEVLARIPVPAAIPPLRLALAAKLDEAEQLEANLSGAVS